MIDCQIDANDQYFWSSKNEFYRDNTSRYRSWSQSFLLLDSLFQIDSEEDFVYHLQIGTDWQVFRFQLRCQRVAMKDHFKVFVQLKFRHLLALALIIGSAKVRSTGSQAIVKSSNCCSKSSFRLKFQLPARKT